MRRPLGTWQLLRRYGSLGIEMAVAVLIGAWGGHGLDEWLGTTPWLLLIGFIFGAAAGFLNIARLIASEQTRKKEKGDG
ncbi:MAG: AtpZ/AtpI family protein [Nitrospiria bacterium]